jgi:hypothetical protein
VRALVRGRDQAALEAIPQSVAVVRGDIGSYEDCLRAMQVLSPDPRPLNHAPEFMSSPSPAMHQSSSCHLAKPSTYCNFDSGRLLWQLRG